MRVPFRIEGLLPALATSLFALTINAGEAHAEPDTLTKEVARLLETQAEDWNRANLEGFCAVYAEDAIFVAPSGVRTGRAEILARYRERYGGTPEKMGRLELQTKSVRPIGKGKNVVGASVVLEWKLTFPRNDVKPARGYSLLVLRRGSHGWKITHDASM